MKTFLIILSLLVGNFVYAQSLEVTKPWVRATVEGQKSTGAFMNLKAKENLELIRVNSDVANIEIHEMKMEGDIMRMRGLDKLVLPAGKNIELKPGNLHLMFTNLKNPLLQNSSVDLNLTVKNSQGKEENINVKAQVLQKAP